MATILTNAHLSDEAKNMLEEGGKYKVKTVERAGPADYQETEILLLERPGLWITKDRIAQMPNLRLIQSASAGLDDIDFGILPEQVQVCGNVGAYADPIAEYVFGVVFYLGKDIAGNQNNLKKGDFIRNVEGLYLKGKTIGVVGAGGIGEAVARVAKSFGMHTIGMNTTGTPVPNFDRVVSPEGLSSLLEKSDVVLFALPLTRRTENMIDASKLRLMKEDCIIVNVGRGRVINEKALYEHLKAHPQFRAAIDVWWVYPKPGEKFAQHYPFFDLPNFLGSPHISGDVSGSIRAAVGIAATNVRRYIEGKPVKGLAKRSDYDWSGPTAVPTTA